MPEHIPEDLLDRYSMGTIPADSVAQLEEHLLSCPFCQERLVETDEALNLFRAAATDVAAHPAVTWHRLWDRRKVFWAGAVSAAAALLFFLIAGEAHKTQAPPAILLMQSLRGPASEAHLASGRPRLLVFDLAIDAAPRNYEIEIVDAVGNRILTEGADVRDGRLTALVKVARGAYWVRVYQKQAGRELVAEYGLRAD
jgi:hypothetical protein